MVTTLLGSPASRSNHNEGVTRARVCVLLVEEMVVDFDLSVGFEVIRQEHDGNRNLAEIIDLHNEETRLLGAFFFLHLPWP